MGCRCDGSCLCVLHWKQWDWLFPGWYPAHLQPPAPDYPRVIHDGVMKSSWWGFPLPPPPPPPPPSSLTRPLDPLRYRCLDPAGLRHPGGAAGAAGRTRSGKGAPGAEKAHRQASRRGLENTKVKQSHPQKCVEAASFSLSGCDPGPGSPAASLRAASFLTFRPCLCALTPSRRPENTGPCWDQSL